MSSMEDLWRIVTSSRRGILATNGKDGRPQLSNIYYLVDEFTQVIRFSTTTVRTKGRNLLRDPRVSLHVAGRDFFNFAVVTGEASVAVPQDSGDTAIDELFEIHSGLGASLDREGFGEKMLADHRMAVELPIARIYGQILQR